ncbi:MerR family transcriptional regulator, partial [Schumannella sp. 10F1B-5-1]
MTSRTLRHYDDVGLVRPSGVGAGGIRIYDAAALVRLQRVLLLRELGLGLPAIAEVLDGQTDDVHALLAHREWLR